MTDKPEYNFYIDGKPMTRVELRLLDKEALIDEIISLKKSFEIIRHQLNNTIGELKSLMHEVDDDS